MSLEFYHFYAQNTTFPDFTPTIFLQIVNYATISILAIAFICTIIVFISLIVRRFSKKNSSSSNTTTVIVAPTNSLEYQKFLSQIKKTVFSDLTHDSILFLILSEFEYFCFLSTFRFQQFQFFVLCSLDSNHDCSCIGKYICWWVEYSDQLFSPVHRANVWTTGRFHVHGSWIGLFFDTYHSYLLTICIVVSAN